MSYLCRHVLLKDAAGETQGFARFESAPDGCSVDARASGVPSGTRLLLLRRGGGFREAGAMREGAFRSLLRGEDAAGLCGAAIAQAGKALVFGGEGDVSAQARKAAAQAFAPKAVSASRAERCRAVAAEPCKHTEDVKTADAVPSEAFTIAKEPEDNAGARDGEATSITPLTADSVPPEAFTVAKKPEDGARVGEAAPITPQPATNAMPPEAFTIAKEPEDGAGAREGEAALITPPPAAAAVPPEAFAVARKPEDGASARDGEAALITSPPADSVPPEAFTIAKEPEDGASIVDCEAADGWTFRSAGDGLRFDAVYQQDGSVVLSAHAIAADTPLPPPGLPTAERVSGFWIEKNKKI